MRQVLVMSALLAVLSPETLAHGRERSRVSARFRALEVTPVSTEGTWKILDRDGANRQVEPYLSSLGQGEAGTGAIVSPPFTVATSEITMTLCGHDGPQGDRKKNFVALVDVATGKTLRKTFAPLSDPMQPRSWNVEDLRGRRVRFEAHDNDPGGAFAWLGVGRLDAGPALRVDFRESLPGGWESVASTVALETGVVEDGVPFLSLRSQYSMVPAAGAAEIPCGVEVERLFVLGGTVSRGSPLEVCGWIELRYREGPPERYPLMYGFTLDGQYKLLSPSRALFLHPSGDAFQYYLVIEPRGGVVEQIRLEHAGAGHAVPRITALTCETRAAGEGLLPLPDCRPSPDEIAWIESHGISAGSPDLDAVREEIRRAHRLRPQEGPKVLGFERVKISDRTFEAASACDVNGDGNMDIVSGAYWYEGPAFARSHKITDVAPAGEYWDDFSDYPMDVNGDGKVDIVTGAFFGGPLRWLENPGERGGEWKTHPIAQVGAIETTRFWDVDGDGLVEICPNAGGNVVFFRLVRDGKGRGTGEFTRHVVKMGGCGHGLGFGDINGDGRGDFVVPDAWIEAPADPLDGEWTWRDDGFRLGAASVPILVHDVDDDGRADMIVGQAHGYGLDWYEQGVDGEGRRSWTRHRIDRGSSQFHDMMLVDMDRDGEPELVTGKRYRAHNGNDPGAADPVFVRYFDIEDGDFVCHTLDYGPAGRTSGVGIYFWVEDVDGNGWKDIVAPGKEGLYLFRNMGK